MLKKITQKQIVWALVIIALLVALYHWKWIAKQFGYDAEEGNDNDNRLNTSSRQNACNDIGADCSYSYTDANGQVITLNGKKTQGRYGCKCLIEAPSLERIQSPSNFRYNVCNNIGGDCSFSYTDANGVVVTLNGKYDQGRSGCKCVLESPTSNK